MGLLRSLRERLDAASLRYDISTGRKVWGRQPGPGDGSKMGATTRARSSIAAVVIRADGTREDLGVLHEGEVALTQEQIEALKRASRE